VKSSSLLKPAILGGFDGTASLLGVVIYLLITHPALIFPTAASGAISSAISMGGGEFLSDSDNGLAASGVMALATFAGAVLPAVPFAFGTGPAEITVCSLIVIAIGAAVSAMRPNRGRSLALAETFGLLALVAVVVVICGLLLPGGTA
jgi:VIT1/CCC1 family predicted Fe2+/Mn2+ transporter